MLTKKQKEEYLKQPDFCPYCGSGKFDGDKIEPTNTDPSNTIEGAYEIEMTCTDCGSVWKEIYIMSDIIEVCGDPNKVLLHASKEALEYIKEILADSEVYIGCMDARDENIISVLEDAIKTAERG